MLRVQVLGALRLLREACVGVPMQLEVREHNVSSALDDEVAVLENQLGIRARDRGTITREHERGLSAQRNETDNVKVQTNSGKHHELGFRYQHMFGAYAQPEPEADDYHDCTLDLPPKPKPGERADVFLPKYDVASYMMSLVAVVDRPGDRAPLPKLKALLLPSVDRNAPGTCKAECKRSVTCQ